MRSILILTLSCAAMVAHAQTPDKPLPDLKTTEVQDANLHWYNAEIEKYSSELAPWLQKKHDLLEQVAKANPAYEVKMNPNTGQESLIPKQVQKLPVIAPPVDPSKLNPPAQPPLPTVQPAAKKEEPKK